jgi:hypothetical protein
MAALKAVLQKTEVDKLPEAVRGYYAEVKDKPGTFHLELDGAVIGGVDPAEHETVKTSLREFRTNNIQLQKDITERDGRLAKFEGVDPEEYKTLKEKAGKLKGKGVEDENDVAKIIAAEVSKALKPVQEALTQEREARTKSEQAAADAKFEQLVTADASLAKVRPTSLRHVIRDARDVFELKDGKLVDKNGEGLSTKKWLEQLAANEGHMFETSTGGGANNNGNGGGPNAGFGRPDAKVLVNPTPEELGAHEAGLIDGSVVVQRT